MAYFVFLQNRPPWFWLLIGIMRISLSYKFIASFAARIVFGSDISVVFSEERFRSVIDNHALFDGDVQRFADCCGIFEEIGVRRHVGLDLDWFWRPVLRQIYRWGFCKIHQQSSCKFISRNSANSSVGAFRRPRRAIVSGGRRWATVSLAILAVLVFPGGGAGLCWWRSMPR